MVMRLLNPPHYENKTLNYKVTSVNIFLSLIFEIPAPFNGLTGPYCTTTMKFYDTFDKLGS